MKLCIKLILYPSSINLSWIEEQHIPPIQRNNNITWYLVLIEKWGMAESKWFVTLLKQRSNVALATGKLYLTVQQRNILTRVMYSRGRGGHLKQAHSFITWLFSCGWSCLRVTQNGNVSGMWVSWPPLEGNSWVLATLPMICMVGILNVTEFASYQYLHLV